MTTNRNLKMTREELAIHAQELAIEIESFGSVKNWVAHRKATEPDFIHISVITKFGEPFLKPHELNALYDAKVEELNRSKV